MKKAWRIVNNVTSKHEKCNLRGRNNQDIQQENNDKCNQTITVAQTVSPLKVLHDLV